MALSRSRSVNDIKLEYGCSATKKADAGAGPRFNLVTDIDVYEGYLAKMKEKGMPKLRSMSDLRSVKDLEVDQGYPFCTVRNPLGPRGWPRLIYDRTDPKPANPAEVADCIELAKLAIDFFNKDNPHMPFNKDAVELVKVTSDFLMTGSRYHVMFVTKSDFRIEDDRTKSKKPVFRFFESETWYGSRTAEVRLVRIVMFWKPFAGHLSHWQV